MGVFREEWIADIEENLYQTQEFLKYATDHSSYIIGVAVHVPQAGAIPVVTKNRSSFPATTVQRTDTDLNYAVNNWGTTPIMVSIPEAEQSSYNKRMAIMHEHILKLDETIGNNTLYTWAPHNVGVTSSVNVVRTVSMTGATSSLAMSPSATGSRNALTLADIASAKAILDSDNVPQVGRQLLIPSSIFNTQLLAISNISQYLQYGNDSAIQKGDARSIYGFNVMHRPSVLVYTGGTASGVLATLSDDGTVTTPGAGDCLACLAWHPSCVAKANGTVDVIINERRADYNGADIISAIVLQGSKNIRADFRGIVSIIQQ